MRKKLLILFGFVALSTLGLAQQNYDWAIGVRGGNPAGITAKKFFEERISGELLVGIDFNRGLGVTGLGEFNFYLTEGANWYAGGGISMYGENEGFSFGFDAIAGIEFTLPIFPINFGVDYKPSYVFGNFSGFDPTNFGFSIRYVIR
ncbi:MAG: hypothetical protein AAFV80_16305 [Bacteroidota bacterium]